MSPCFYSYHSAKAVPKKSSRKQVIYDYIKTQITAGRVQKTHPGFKIIRKFELDDNRNYPVAFNEKPNI